MPFGQRISIPDVDPEAYKPMLAITAINAWNRLAVSTHQDLPQQEE